MKVVKNNVLFKFVLSLVLLLGTLPLRATTTLNASQTALRFEPLANVIRLSDDVAIAGSTYTKLGTIEDVYVTENNLSKLETVEIYKNADGVLAWRALVNAGVDIPIGRIVDNYTPTLTGKIVEFINTDGSLFGRLYRQTTNFGKIEYTFKWTKPDGNIVNITGLSAELDEGFIEIDLLLNQVQGKGVGKVIFDDVFKHYDGVNTNYQGFRGRWEGNNPAYSNGSSDNLVKYWQARNTMTKSEAAFETWSGKRALENGFINANVIEESNGLIIVEFTK